MMTIEELAEFDRLRTRNAELLDALKAAEITLATTLKARGYPIGSTPKSEWALEVRREIATLMLIRTTLAKASEGQTTE